MPWTYDSLKVGDKDSISTVVSAEDVAQFARLSKDNNPLHLDEDFAKTSPFGRCIAHGMFSAGLISAVLGTRLPGNGSVYMSQFMKFRRPVFIGETITAWAEVGEKHDAKKRLTMKTWVTNEQGEMVVEGEALLMFDK